jgi:hypothetical protein
MREYGRITTEGREMTNEQRALIAEARDYAGQFASDAQRIIDRIDLDGLGCDYGFISIMRLRAAVHNAIRCVRDADMAMEEADK